MKYAMKKMTLATASASMILLAGCATTHEPSNELTELQTRYNSVVSSQNLEEYAPVAFDEAGKSIARLETLENDDADDYELEHQQYLAERKLDTAIELAKHNRSQEYIDDADVRRKDLMLQARERDLTQAEREAAFMKSRAEAAEQRAEMAVARANSMEEKASQMASKLESVTTKLDKRGLVITMGDILFATDESEVKPGAVRTLEKVSDLLAEYPDREILVEGFTDSTGAADYNKNLSELRAEAVVKQLVDNGLAEDRLSAKGYGEEYPVASNDTAAGRQQNRRVELVVANKDDKAVDDRVAQR
ncbi:OmpA family protein [Teredinibacter turnerae]|uniref:OmpA family protein n=1 Tax=Teredinibacter turnerae TaxID=2426 RepID=UPI0030D5287E